MVQLVEERVKCPKEINEIRVALVALVEDIKAGKDLVLIAGENLQSISSAIAGLDQIDDEIRETLPESVQCLGLMAGEIIGLLMKKDEVPAQPVVPAVEENA